LHSKNVGVAGAYTASIPFKPLIYIGAILFTPWVADNVAHLGALDERRADWVFQTRSRPVRSQKM